MNDNNLITFLQKYDSEDRCESLFKQIRDKEGVVCKRCGGQDHYWLGFKRSRYRCKACNWETTLRSGTALEWSKLPYRYWIYAMAFIASRKKPMSAYEMQRILGHKFYQPIWTMMHKIRLTMGHREALYKLDGYVEADDAHFEVSKLKQETKDDKKGRGAKGKAKVSVMAQTAPGDKRRKDKKSKGAFKYVKMQLVEDLSIKTLTGVLNKGITARSTVITDGWAGYDTKKLHVARHIKKNMQGAEAVKQQPWVHLMISNAKRNLLGIYHSVKQDYLQNYLNEFCYITNRRYLNERKINHLLRLSACKSWHSPFVHLS